MLTCGNELSEETYMLIKQETFLGRGARAEKGRVREPRRTALPRGSSLRFYGDGLVSGLSLASHSDSVSFLVVHTLLNQDGLQQGGFWEVGRTYRLGSPLSF